MTEFKIDFRQQRDFGEVLNATFAFLRLNVGKLGKALLFYVCPFLIIQGIARVYYDTSLGEITGMMFRHGMELFYAKYFTAAAMLLLTIFLSSLMANLTVYSYIKVYVDGEKNKMSLDDVWRKLRKNFLRVLLASLLTSLLYFFGFIMCFVPGIYLYISLCFVIIIIMYEGKSFGKSFKRSFSLAHYQWWSIFLLILVLYFILYIVSLVFSIPVTLIKATYTLNSLNPDGDGSIIKYILIAITMLSTLAWGFLTCVMYIALSFKYFSIIEKKENPRLLNDISMMEQL